MGGGEHREPLAAVEHAVAGGAVAHAHAHQLLLARQQHGPRRAHGQQHGLGLHHVAFHQQHEAAVVGQYLAYQTNAFLRAQRERLRLECGDQLRAGGFRQAGVVVDTLGTRKPACAALRTNKQGGHAPHTRRDGAA
ncbi:hypothetical protein SDC9_157461 [bioreactor metagenome]|uniref:Uncharacterized protein n=1 Tax=bioreactor metagenome TaxID=1076179 RepID=A0A645F969_9ZZZZ